MVTKILEREGIPANPNGVADRPNLFLIKTTDAEVAAQSRDQWVEFGIPQGRFIGFYPDQVRSNRATIAELQDQINRCRLPVGSLIADTPTADVDLVYLPRLFGDASAAYTRERQLCPDSVILVDSIKAEDFCTIENLLKRPSSFSRYKDGQLVAEPILYAVRANSGPVRIAESRTPEGIVKLLIKNAEIVSLEVPVKKFY